MTDRKHIDPTIYTTRPTDERLEKENRVYDLLEELSIPFVRIDHDAMNTIDELICLQKSRVTNFLRPGIIRR